MKRGRVKGGSIEQARVLTNRGHRTSMAHKVSNGANLTRNIQGGATTPIFVLKDNDTVDKGGQYKLKGGPAQPMIVRPSGRIKGGSAKTVYPVDVNGDYDYSFPRSDYMARVLSVERDSLIGYWVQDEAGGLVSYDSSPEKNDGVYTAVILGAAGIGDELTSASFDGAASFNNIYSAALNVDFNGSEGTLIAWARVANAGVWTDGVARAIIRTRVDANNYIDISKGAANNTITFVYIAGGVAESQTALAINSLGFVCCGITWNKAGDAVKYYINGIPSGPTDIGLGIWAGALSAIETVIGASSTFLSALYSGEVAHVQLRNSVLSPAQMLGLGVL